jgi:hypothetical protein
VRSINRWALYAGIITDVKQGTVLNFASKWEPNKPQFGSP